MLAAGTGGVILAGLGLEPAPMFWALVGATLGITFAASTTKARAVLVFLSVVLSCSLFGAWLAHRYAGGESISRNAFACGLAVAFHPLLQMFITKLPALWDAVVSRWFGAGVEKP